MSKINVYSSSASYAIKVFDANSTGLKPDNAILVTTGTEPSNAIQINVDEQKWSSIAVNFGGDSPVPPTPPTLPPYTIRLKFNQGTNPRVFEKGTAVLVDEANNIWDLTYENPDWHGLLRHQNNLVEVIDANTEGVTNMNEMFSNCLLLTTVSLFDTSNVTYMYRMFDSCFSLTTIPLFNTSKVTNMYMMFNYCSSLSSIPLFDTSKVTDMSLMFYDCTNVQNGALELYKQASTQANPPTTHNATFQGCGSNTETGAAELAQIPSDWK